MLKRIVAVALATASALALSSAARADGLVYDTNLAAPGVYFGTGNINGHFTVDTENGVEVGLRGHVYQQNATAPVNNVYSFALGDLVSFDWSVNPDVGASPVDLSQTMAIITIHDFANNNTQSFPADFPPLGNNTDAAAPGAYQNSERLAFPFVDQFYNPNQNNTFSVNLTLSNVPQAGTISVTEYLQQGTGAVPEPATWALMILGFGGAGAALRRRRAFAAA